MILGFIGGLLGGADCCAQIPPKLRIHVDTTPHNARFMIFILPLSLVRITLSKARVRHAYSAR